MGIPGEPRSLDFRHFSCDDGGRKRRKRRYDGRTSTSEEEGQGERQGKG